METQKRLNERICEHLGDLIGKAFSSLGGCFIKNPPVGSGGATAYQVGRYHHYSDAKKALGCSIVSGLVAVYSGYHMFKDIPARDSVTYRGMDPKMAIEMAIGDKKFDKKEQWEYYNRCMEYKKEGHDLDERSMEICSILKENRFSDLRKTLPNVNIETINLRTKDCLNLASFLFSGYLSVVTLMISMAQTSESRE